MKYLIIILLIFNHFAKGNTGAVVSTEKSKSEWKLAKNQNNIKVYTRQPEGSNIKEFKATTTVSSTIKKIESILDNAEAYPSWIANIESVKVLKRINKNDLYIYYQTKVPWPITSRDMVLKSMKSINSKGVLSYNSFGYPDYLEKDKDYIRIRNAKGK